MSNTDLDQIIARGQRCRVRMLRTQLMNANLDFRDAQRAIDRRRRQHHLDKMLRAARALMREIGPLATGGATGGAAAARPALRPARAGRGPFRKR